MEHNIIRAIASSSFSASVLIASTKLSCADDGEIDYGTAGQKAARPHVGLSGWNPRMFHPPTSGTSIWGNTAVTRCGGSLRPRHLPRRYGLRNANRARECSPRQALLFSKKLENHISAIWYFINHYNASFPMHLSFPF